MTYALQNHPNVDKIIATVHPKIAEVTCGGHDFILDIKKNKKEFNLI